MMELKGNKIDVLDAISKGPGYRYFGDTKFLPIPIELFDKPLRGEEDEV
jgi:hypothetical protein